MSGKETKCRREKALERAESIRQFEIELYWKRSAYFWTFIALAFAGYGALLLESPTLNDRLKNLHFLLANVGFVASFAWFLANRGSKYWQEQWESHVDRLEDCVTGPLYKVNINRHYCNRRNGGRSFWQWMAGPSKFSVSKINQIGSLYVTIVWGVLGVKSFLWLYDLFLGWPKYWDSAVFFALTGLTILAFCICGRTKLRDYCYESTVRRVKPIRCDCDSCDCCQRNSPVNSRKERITLRWSMGDRSWSHWAQGRGGKTEKTVVLEQLEKLRKNSEALRCVQLRCAQLRRSVLESPGQDKQKDNLRNEIEIQIPSADWGEACQRVGMIEDGIDDGPVRPSELLAAIILESESWKRSGDAEFDAGWNEVSLSSSVALSTKLTRKSRLILGKRETVAAWIIALSTAASAVATLWLALRK